MVGAKKRKELAEGLRGVFAAPSRRTALALASELADEWRERGHEKVAKHLEEHIEECLSCLEPFPKAIGGASAPPTAPSVSIRR